MKVPCSIGAAWGSHAPRFTGEASRVRLDTCNTSQLHGGGAAWGSHAPGFTGETSRVRLDTCNTSQLHGGGAAWGSHAPGFTGEASWVTRTRQADLVNSTKTTRLSKHLSAKSAAPGQGRGRGLGASQESEPGERDRRASQGGREPGQGRARAAHFACRRVPSLRKYTRASASGGRRCSCPYTLHLQLACRRFVCNRSARRCAAARARAR